MLYKQILLKIDLKIYWQSYGIKHFHYSKQKN